MFFLILKIFSLGRVVLYTVFMVFPLPQTLVKNLAKNLVKHPDGLFGPLKGLKGVLSPLTHWTGTKKRDNKQQIIKQSF